MGKFRWRTAIQVLTLLGVAGCAMFSSKPDERERAMDERWLELTERLNLQEAELNRLRAGVEALSTKEKPVEVVKPEPVVEKVVPKTQIRVKPKAKAEVREEGHEEITLVDSKHEAMHLYFKGLSEIEQGRLDSAIENFREFLKLNPDHIYADRAQFHLVDAYFKGKEYNLAVMEANKLQTRFPYSFRIPEALWAKGASFESLEQLTEAKAVFKELVKHFPNHELAEKAGERLALLSSAPPLLQSE